MRLLPPLACAVLSSGLALLCFSSAGRDDVYITYWPAHTLAASGEILNYNGERVEQSSSLLHVLLLGLLDRVTGVEPTLLGGLFALLSGALGVVGIHALARRIEPRAAPGAALLTATSACYAYWSVGGMEATLVSVVFIGLILAYARALDTAKPAAPDALLAASATLLLLLVRPEMVFVLPALLLGALAFTLLPGRRGQQARRLRGRLLGLLGLALAAIALLVSWRLLYFGAPFPQPVVAKAGGSLAVSLLFGAGYLRSTLLPDPASALLALALGVSLAAALLHLLRAERAHPAELLSLAAVGSYASFVVLAGGDWMEGGRFLVPVLPLALMFVALAAARLFAGRLALVGALAVLTLAQLVSLYDFARESSTGMPLWDGLRSDRSSRASFGAGYSWFERTNRIHLRDLPVAHQLKEIVARVHRRKGDEVVVLSWQMGLAVYALVREQADHVRVIDLAGLVERSFSECALLDDRPRTPIGMLAPLPYYLEHAAALRDGCGIPEPDVLFGLGIGGSVPGYVGAYQQLGPVRHETTWLPGAEVWADQFIAVRDEWAAVLDELETHRLVF